MEGCVEEISFRDWKLSIMRVLFFSCFPNELFRDSIEKGVNPSQTTQAGQKFEKMLVTGMCANGFDVDVIFFYRCFDEDEIEVEESFYDRKVYNHGKRLCGNLFQRTKDRHRYLKKIITTWAKENPNSFAVIDALNPYSLEVSKLAKRNKVLISTFVTDIIDYILIDNHTLKRRIRNNFVKWMFYKQFSFSDELVLLTENMSEKINCKGKKTVVIDGMCDISTEKELNDYSESKTIFMYTGIISRKYGLENLVLGFLNSNCNNSELHLYGSGDYVDDIVDLDNRIKYFGVVPNERIHTIQSKATFLVNPRPVTDEYTKYSFPSKNIEYLTTGTAVVTTRLPCIGIEYDEFFYYFDGDDIKAISKTLYDLSCIPKDELKKKGKKSYEFVIKNKNNIIQTRKMIDALRGGIDENTVAM